MSVITNATLLGAGIVKQVWQVAGNSTKVFYTPRSWGPITLPWCHRELKQEVETAKRIQTAVAASGHSIEHLAVSLQVSSRSIHNRLTIETERAIGDLETIMTRSTLSFTERLQICAQVSEGMRALHAGEMLHGDLKPENILIYQSDTGEYTAKLSDWGKAKEQSPGTTSMYRGNARFAPPEYRSSYPGEVYSLGLTLLRVLEEAILTPSKNVEMLITPLKQKQISLQNTYRGFLKYIFIHESSYYPRSKWFRWIKAFYYRLRSDAVQKKQEKNQELTYTYIDALSKHMGSRKLCSEQTALKLANMLKQSMHIDPLQRPSSEHVYETMQTILEKHLDETNPAPIAPPKPTSSSSAFQRYIQEPLSVIHTLFSLMRGVDAA